jgi:solute carrier family 35 protein
MQLVSAGLYAVVATSMSLINRFALLAFPLPTILLLLQMVATLLILYPLLATGVLSFSLFRRTRFWQLFGISFLYTANTAFALFGLKTLNLPM